MTGFMSIGSVGVLSGKCEFNSDKARPGLRSKLPIKRKEKYVSYQGC